jgi:3-oxoacyl-[acyl-carrier protein] reductase
MLEKDIALVTGASRGIGNAIALALGAAGATVIGTATSEEGAQKFGAALAAAGAKGHGAVLDASNPASIDALLAGLEAAGESPSILVNNAAITRDTLLLRMKPEDWDAVITTNLTSVFRLSKACVRRMMKERNGRIVNLTSVVGLTGNAGQVNYAAAKAGLLGFTKSLAKELASRGITVNAVAPGIIESPMAGMAFPPERIKQLVPAQRAGQPEEVASMVAYLVSDAAAYVTGQVLSINGGLG